MDINVNREKQKIDWVTMNMCLDGNPISTENATKIASGEYILEATLEDHMTVTHLVEVLPLMYTLLSMQEDLSPATLNKFYGILSDGEDPLYRKTTPVLFHLSYNPVLPQEIQEELRKLFSAVYRDSSLDPIEKAVHIHDHLIRIYPFDDHSETIARAALEYQLMSSGLPIIPITLTEQDYNNALTQFLKFGKEAALVENLRVNKLMMESVK